MIKKILRRFFGKVKEKENRQQTYIRKTALLSNEFIALSRQDFRTGEERERFFRAVYFSRNHI